MCVAHVHNYGYIMYDLLLWETATDIENDREVYVGFKFSLFSSEYSLGLEESKFETT